MDKFYIDPMFQEALNNVSVHVKNEVDRSFDIAARIDALLKKKGWTKTELAKRTGKKSSEVSKWLSGTQNFTLRTIALIEEVLDCNLIKVMDGASDNNTVNVHYVVSIAAVNSAWKQSNSDSKRSGKYVNAINQWI